MKETANLPKIIKQIEEQSLRTWLISSLTQAFKEARKHKLKTFNEHAFEVNWNDNIIKLADAIIEQIYKPSSSITFIVFDPMIREIFAAPFIDRVVHHLLYELQGGWWDHRFIEDSYSCREGKGTLYGVLRTWQMMRAATKGFTEEAFIIKLDIKGFFMSMPRKELFRIVKKGLKKQFAPYFGKSSAAFQLYRMCCFLWYQILMDNPIIHAHRRGKLSNWQYLPPEKSLYCQPPDVGIVIGNLTSQLVSNIYLNRLDRYIKYDLKYRYYGRYVDDFFIIVPKSQYAQAKRDVKKIEKFLKEKLYLTLHPKKRYYQSVYKGVQFLGVRIYPHCLYPSNRLQKKFNHTMHRLYIGDESLKLETIISYFGQLKHLHGDKYVHRVFAKYELDYALYLKTQNPETHSVKAIVNEIVAHGKGKGKNKKK